MAVPLEEVNGRYILTTTTTLSLMTWNGREALADACKEDPKAGTQKTINALELRHSLFEMNHSLHDG